MLFTQAWMVGFKLTLQDVKKINSGYITCSKEGGMSVTLATMCNFGSPPKESFHVESTQVMTQPPQV
jgi:hypothetical protein